MRVLFLVLSVCVSAAQAQHPHGAASPYTDMRSRTIKAFSETQHADLLAGRGMSLALAAELNGYPGPLHVLELAVPLGLSDAQRRAHEDMVHRMKAETQALGRDLVAAEERLDRLFASRAASPAQVRSATAEIGQLQGRLRAAHLLFHIETLAALTPQQVERYETLRGYRKSP
jgi:hypothetical protein